MTTKEMLVAISAKTGFSQKDIKTVIDRVSAKDEVKICNGITFCGIEKPAHEARNPRTGETVSVPAKVQFKTKIGAAIKNAIN